MFTPGCSRRQLIRSVGGGIGMACVASAWGTATVEADDNAPAVEWTRSYPGNEREYEHAPMAFRQTADDGYVLGGKGAPITETGPEKTQFSCLKATPSGEPEWIAFGLDDHARPLHRAEDIVQVRENGFALVGQGKYSPEDDNWDRRSEPIARVAKFTAEGDLEWTAVFDQFAEEEDEARSVDDSPRFRALTGPVADGGPVAVGDQAWNGWAVKFTSEGDVAWQQRYEEEGWLKNALTIPDGYLFHSVREDEDAVLHVNTSGAVTRKVVLEIDYEAIPYNHIVRPTADGGYAITGDYAPKQRMVIQKFDATGAAEWLKTYNGPYDGHDEAYDIDQTDDGGFVLFGDMQAAYSGDIVPAVVKTDPAGTEEWQTLLESEERRGYHSGTQTSDGGYAAFSSGSNHFLVKYEPPSSADASESGNDEGSTAGDDQDESDSDEEKNDESSDEEDQNDSETGTGDGGEEPADEDEETEESNSRSEDGDQASIEEDDQADDSKAEDDQSNDSNIDDEEKGGESDKDETDQTSDSDPEVENDESDDSAGKDAGDQSDDSTSDDEDKASEEGSGDEQPTEPESDDTGNNGQGEETDEEGSESEDQSTESTVDDDRTGGQPENDEIPGFGLGAALGGLGGAIAYYTWGRDGPSDEPQVDNEPEDN